MLVLTRKRNEKIVTQPSPRLIDEIRTALKRAAPPELAIEANMALDVLGKPIVVTLVDIRGDKCRLGFEADPAIIIHRQEVVEAIQRDTK